MAHIKKQHEISAILEGGSLIGEILESLGNLVKPGMTTAEVDAIAEEKIRAVGGRPAFKHFASHPDETPFPSTICASVNEEVVHGIATHEKVLHAGDIFSIDIGMEWPLKGLSENKKNPYSKLGGFFTDTAITVPVGEIKKEDQLLLERTYLAMEKGIAAATAGASISTIGRVIEDYVTPFGYGIVEDLCGHGVGHEVHEDPNVLNFYDKRLDAWKLKSGMVICIEPMLNLGTKKIGLAKDGWSIITKDKKRSAHFEHTIVITKDGPVVATKRPSETL